MADKNNLVIQREINQNLSVATHQPFAMTNEELEFNAKFAYRVNRRRNCPEKKEQQRNTLEWVNRSTADTIMELGPGDKNKGSEIWAHSMNKENLITTQQNNKKSSENLETLRENIRNSQESLKARSSESLTIEEAYLRNRSNSIDSLKKRVAEEPTIEGTVKRNKSVEMNKQRSKDSVESLHESNYDLSRSYMHASMKDPHTAAIDLSNNCRQFYFNHLKSAEAIKQSVRAAKHNRAREKMEGRPGSSLDNAMDRLRSEMADLMDQDLSLMSQLLKLNDKIEEVKSHVLYRKNNETCSQSSCYLSNSEISDSEIDDNDDSRIDLSQSTSSFDAKPEPEVVLRKISPADSDIIIYRKKTRRGKRRRLTDHSKSGTDDEDTGEESDTSYTSSHSDTESTLSCNSNANNEDSGTDKESKTDDTFDEETKPNKDSDKPDEPPKQVEGGVSQNRRFLSFLKKNGNAALPGKNPLLTLQGHNVPLDKYFVPQGLVYLKHSNSDNVFCQFSN
ncbi:hypothetical protein ACF0H5_004290 [Mactra antiquata]